MSSDNSIQIVSNGIPKAIIVVPDDYCAEIRPSDSEHIGYTDAIARGYTDDQSDIFLMDVQKEAQSLVAYIAKSSTALLEIKTDSKAKNDNRIHVHVGFTNFVKQKQLQIAELDDDAFILDSTDPRNIIIVGPTCWAIKFAVCEFLERYLGIRWLFPGPDGEDVPKVNTISIARERIEQKPAFISRLFSGFCGTTPHVWARFNRIHGRIKFHHGLDSIFAPARYTKTHPYFFPIHDGKRFLPPAGAYRGWQPCLTNDEVVEEAVKNICAYFDENKQAVSYSLGVNDCGGFCQCDQCKAKMGNKTNFLGAQDLSDYYFEWCNKVVKGVLEKHPGKYFGCLAYGELVEPPKHTKVDKHIIPFMTYDRLQYADTDLRKVNMQKTEDWLKTVGTLGWYDYFYGTPYSVPRIYFHQMAEFFRLGYEAGVKVFYAEAYPNWGEGPKLYLALKLMWNPYIDVDAVLEEWYVRMVGVHAAQYLAEYFKMWEEFWSKRITTSAWFRQDMELSVYNRKMDYLNIEQVGYLDFVTRDDITRSRQLLGLACENAETELQKSRARVFLRAFEFYEISTLAYMKGKSTLNQVVESEARALDSLDAGVQCFQMVDKRKKMSLEEFAADPIFCQPQDVTRSPENTGKNWGESSIWSAFDWYSKSAKVKQQVDYLAEKSPNKRIRQQMQFMLMSHDPESKPVSVNPYFEEGIGNKAAGWDFVFDANSSRMHRTDEIANTGKFSILCESVNRGFLQSEIPAVAGTYGAITKIFYPSKTKGARVWITMIPLNSDGKTLRRFLPEEPILAEPKIGDWNTVAIMGELDEVIRGEKVKTLRLIVHVQGLQPGEKVFIGSAMIYRIC